MGSIDTFVRGLTETDVDAIQQVINPKTIPSGVASLNITGTKLSGVAAGDHLHMGVHQLIAGTGISFSPSSGFGDVQITASSTPTQFLNTSTVTLNHGDVIIIDNIVPNAVRLLTNNDVAARKKLILGIINVGGPPASTVTIISSGVDTVLVDGLVQIGDYITGTITPTITNPSPMRGGVVDNSPTTGTAFAQALEPKIVGLGLVQCIVQKGII